ncbi:unnamed protein product [Protopolystoma xenopodis]|uniref:Uncharacterized protein n=1 Tax=Protopolystoma xenopodis TaxID=117903 RepID=A0A448X8E2_9PLAT|nr:unnamed protein product [Protopolystoma xenopodis]
MSPFSSSQISYLKGSRRVVSPCEKAGKWRHFIHALFLNCASLDVNPAIREFTKTLEFYLYLDERRDWADCRDCFRLDVKSQLAGAIIAIDKPDTLGNINDKSINLKPGTLTEIRLSIEQHIQQLPPYGNCSNSTPSHLSLYGMNYTYSESACRQAAIQTSLREHCGCQAIEYPYDPDSRLPFCHAAAEFVPKTACNASQSAKLSARQTNADVDADADAELGAGAGEEASAEHLRCMLLLDKLLERSICKLRVVGGYQNDVVPGCRMPCSFYAYETEKSTSAWPAKVDFD